MKTSEKKRIIAYLSSPVAKRGHAILRALAGSVRVRIMGALRLSDHGLSVSDLAEIFGYSVSRISHQLRILRKYHLVQVHRNSKSMIYEVAHSPFLHKVIINWQKSAHKKI